MKDKPDQEDNAETIRISLGEGGSSYPREGGSDSQSSSVWDSYLFDHRYKFLSLISTKIGSSVSLHWDQELRRNVVIKTQHVDKDEQDRERFLSECRISAAFEHPGIIPIYDIQNSPGKVRLVMRKVEGKTLSDWLAAEYPGKGLSNQKANRLIQIFLEICNVLEFVHSKGHVHRDIKPANIMVGEFGKVFLIDWGSAPTGEAAQWATPTYMSPEQANGEAVDCRSDIFSLGITLFECLFGRPPLPKSNREYLFERRRHGEIDLPTPGERAGVPEPLIAICLKAIDKDINRRYANVRQFANDLANFQAGLAVSAQPDTIKDFAWRWFSRNRSTLIKSTLVAIPFFILCTILYQLLLRDVALWGGAILKETFDSPNWAQNWQQMEQPGWNSKNGGISYLSWALGWESIFLKQRFSAPIAVEFDCLLAETAPGTPPPSDVTLIWAEDGAEPGRQDNYTLMQFGAYSNQLAIIAQNSRSTANAKSSTSIVDFANCRLTPGVVHRFRVEISGDLITMWVDRKQVLQTELQIPLQTGSLGFWAGGFGNKVYDNLTIYSRGVAERAPATMLGDYFLQHGEFLQAEQEFARIQESKVSAAMIQEATFKRGLALWRAGDKDKAQKIWGQITLPRYVLETKILQLGDLFARRDFVRFFSEFQATLQQFPLEKTKKLQLFWASCANQIPGSLIPRTDARALLALTDHAKNCSVAIDLGRHSILLGLEDFQTIRSELSGKIGIPLIHLQKMGLHEEVLARPAQTISCYSAKKNSMLAMENYEAARSISNNNPQWQAEICLHQNGIEKTAELFPKERLTRRNLLLERKQFEELLREQPEDPLSVALALQSLGRSSEILERTGMSTELKILANYDILFDAYLQGDRAQALQKYLDTAADINKKTIAYNDMWFEHIFMPAFLLAHSGQKEAAQERLRAYVDDPANQFRNAQVPWHFIAYLTGQISESDFKNQPTKSRLESRKFLADGIRADINGDSLTALQIYRTYNSFPSHKKDKTIFMQKFIDWRIAELSASAKLSHVEQP